MAADIYTKGFSDKNKWANAIRLINVAKPSDFKGMIKQHYETGSTSLLEEGPESAAPTGAKGSGTPKSKKEKLTAAVFAFPEDKAPQVFEPTLRLDPMGSSDDSSDNDIKQLPRRPRFAEVFS